MTRTLRRSSQEAKHKGVSFVNVRRNAIPEEEHAFLSRVALKLQRRVFAPKERIVPEVRAAPAAAHVQCMPTTAD